MDEPRISLSGLSHVGKVRTNQEDAWAVVEPPGGRERRLRGRLLVAADGIGGSNAGEIASRLAVETISAAYFEEAGDARSSLKRAIQLANTRVVEEGESHPEQRGMGSTVVAAVIHGDRLLVGWLGDSRAYLLRDRALHQITRDHRGISAGGGGLTRWLGMGIAVDPDMRELQLQPGDQVLLCTDGLHGQVTDDELVRLRGRDVSSWTASLVQAALESGAPDNVTVVAARVDRLPFAPHRHPQIREGAMLDQLRLGQSLREEPAELWCSAFRRDSQRLLLILRHELQSDLESVLEMEEEQEALSRVSHPDLAVVEDADAEKSLSYVCLHLPQLDTAGMHALDQLLSGPLTSVETERALTIASHVSGALKAVRDSLLPAGAPHPSDFWGDGSRYLLCRWPGLRRQYCSVTGKGVQVSPLLQDFMPPDYGADQSPGPSSDAYFVGVVLERLLGGSEGLSRQPTQIQQTAAALLAPAARDRPEPSEALQRLLNSTDR